jgi:hypothetical protein
VLILRDVLDWSAAETAELLDTSVLVDRPSIWNANKERHESGDAQWQCGVER